MLSVGPQDSPLRPFYLRVMRARKPLCIALNKPVPLSLLSPGAARGSGTPAVLVCSSGTAVANMLPAVIEAAQTGVPLVVVSADRPAELRDSGANQTIDQVKIFGSYVRSGRRIQH